LKLVSVVVPVYKCQDSLRLLYERVKKTFEGLEAAFELIFVDDGGDQRTWEIIREIVHSDKRVKGLRLSRNFGQHPAIMAGLRASHGDAVLVMDCDLQDPVEMIPTFLAALSDVDIVCSQRSVSGDSYWRRFQNQVYTQLVSWVTGNKINPRLGSFTAISRKVAIEYGKFTEPDHHFLYILKWLGYKTEVINIERSPRLHGKSSYRLVDRLKHAARGALFFSSRVIGIVSLVGLLVVICGMLLLGLILVQSTRGSPVSGWLSVITSIIVFSGLNIVLTAVIGLYIVKTYESSKNRPLYVICEEI